MKQQAAELPIILFESQSAFEGWLNVNAPTSPGVWLQLAKKNAGITSISYDEAVESALCYGWIDSQSKSFDDKTWIQKYTSRGKKSIWSKVNKEKADMLLKLGQIELMKKMPVLKTISGNVKFGQMPTIKYIPLNEYLKNPVVEPV